MKALPRHFVLLAAGVLLSSTVYSSLILDYTLTPRLIAIGILLALLFITLKTSAVSLPFNFSGICYLIFVVFGCISVFWSNTPSEALFEGQKLLASYLVLIVCFHCFNSDKRNFLSLLCKISVVLFFFELALGGYQVLKLGSFQKEALYSVYGINSHKNLFSSFILLQIPFLIIGSINLKGAWRSLSIFALMVYALFVALLQTKAVWIGFAVFFLFATKLFLLRKIKFTVNLKLVIILLIIIGNCFFIFILPNIIHKTIAYNAQQINTKEKKELDNERLVLWEKTYFMFKEHPVIGVGMGNWQVNFPKATLNGLYRAEDLNYTFQRPHNDFLWILSETGLVGFNLFLCSIVSLIVLAVRATRLTSVTTNELIERIVLVSVVPAFFTAAFFDFPKERIEHLVWLHIVFAYCFHLQKAEQRKIPVAMNNVFAAVSLAICVSGLYRFMGELHTRKMYDSKAQNNIPGVINEANKAQNFIYCLDPTSVPIKWYRGNAFALQGNFTAAKTDFSDALRYAPYNRNVLNDLGSAYMNTGDEQKAIEYYQAAIHISPRFDDAKLNLATVYIKQQNYPAADSCLKSVLHDSERRSQYQKLVDAFLPDKNHGN